MAIMTIMLLGIPKLSTFAQTNNVSADSMGIRGVIMFEDSTKVSGAKIEATINGKLIATTFSNQSGAYNIPLTDTGRYSMRVIKNGYKTSVTISIPVSYSKMTILSIRMHKAELDIMVDIPTGCPPPIDLFNPSNRTFTSDEIEKMPR